MQIKAHLNNAAQLLNCYSESPQLDAEILLAHVLKVTRSYLVAYSEKKLADIEAFEALINRRKAGEPIAYITGKKEFWSLELKVNSSVLIPRSETELLVELILKQLPQKMQQSVADLGTGSGAIAIALARECPAWDLWATDNSVLALNTAQVNAQALALTNIHFKQGDWCKALPQIKFDAIISNPPYIAAGDWHLASLSYEPQTALIAAENGLADIMQIINQARDYLITNGILLLEHGYEQGALVAQQLNYAGYQQVRCYQDIAGRDRVTIASWQ